MMRPGGRRRQVVGPGQAGDAVGDDHDVPPISTRALGPLEGELRHLGVLVGGAGQVDAMTSPRTDRRMSVTSSGRSSTSRTIRWTSGLLYLDRLGDGLHHRRLARLGRRHDQAALPLPIGRRSDRRSATSCRRAASRSRRRRSSGNSGVRSSKRDAAGLLRVAAVDLVDAQQRRVLLAPAGGTAGTLRVALAQTELAGLLDRHVDVLGWAGSP